MTIFDNNVGLYFFSAVLQSNAALIAFAAVFAVFRFQLIAQNLQDKDSEIIQFIVNILARKPMEVPEELRIHFTNIHLLENEIKNLVEDNNYKPNYRSWIVALEKNESLSSMFRDRKRLLQKQDNFKKRFRWPMLSLLCVIIFTLCVLPFTYFIHTVFANTELFVFLITILLNVWALALNVNFVFKTIND